MKRKVISHATQRVVTICPVSENYAQWRCLPLTEDVFNRPHWTRHDLLINDPTNDQISGTCIMLKLEMIQAKRKEKDCYTFIEKSKEIIFTVLN